MKKIYYIELDLAGKELVRIPICDFEEGTDYIDKLVFENAGKRVDYYQDISGDFDDLDAFLRDGDIYGTTGDNNSLSGGPSNQYLDLWHTNITGWCTDRYVGLEVS